MGFDHSVMQMVQSIWQWGGAAADPVFAAFTFLGEETFLLVAVFGVYWCLNKRMGEYLLLALYTGIGANGVLKDLVRRPRPFLTPGFEDLRYVQLNGPLVDTVHLRESFSFPSGHSQCAGAFFGGMAAWQKNRRTTALCALMILAVMASRLYLGVHFPTDVLMGAVLGLAMAWGCLWLFRKFYDHRLWLFAAAVGLTLLGLLADPTPDTVKTIGVGLGAWIGMVWESRFCFVVQGSAGRRILRLVLGAAVLMALRLGLKVLFPAGVLFDGLRYALVGFAATGLWPWAFTRLSL